MIRVLVADDQEMVREGFSALLDAQPDISVVGSAGDGVAAVGEVRRLRPDVVLMDVRMPEMDGVDAVVSPSVTKRLLSRFLGEGGGELRDAAVLEALTEREREVLVLIAKGLSNTEIARKLFLSEATVKTHVGRILAKLELRDRVQAVVLAYETGLVRPGDA